jgi:hypothetical protein
MLMTYPGRDPMSRLWILTILIFSLTIIATACSNSGVVAPDNSDYSAPNLQPANDPSKTLRPLHPDPKPPSLAVVPKDDIQLTSIQDLVDSLSQLRNRRGGTDTLESLESDELVVHVWDQITGDNLSADVATVCNGYLVSVLHVNGWAVMQGAAFPVSVTVHVPGYALESYVMTDANVLSFSMSRTANPETSYVFGVTDLVGSDRMVVCTDELTPRILTFGPSYANHQFSQWEVPLTAGQSHAFSAFVKGGIDFEEPKKYAQASQSLLWIAGDFVWNIDPIQPADHRYFGVSFNKNVPPVGIAQGSANLAAIPWGLDTAENAYAYVLPTAIVLDDERYVAIGQPQDLTGTDPTCVLFNAPYFDYPPTVDRIVIAGHLEKNDGSRDIVHADWHPGQSSPTLTFHGVPILEIAPGVETSSPLLSWLNPMSETTDMVRMECITNGPAWNITMPALEYGYDTMYLSIPPAWLSEVFDGTTPGFRMEAIDAISQNINGFTELDLVRWGTERGFSKWSSKEIN